MLWIAFVIPLLPTAVQPELTVTRHTATKDTGCTHVFRARDTTLELLACGNAMELWENGARLGRRQDLGDMNVKGARAFRDGQRLLWVVDVGDEGNSSLSFWAITNGNVTRLGALDWMVDDPDSSSALPHLRPMVDSGRLLLEPTRPVVTLDASGMPQPVKAGRIQVGAKKITVLR